MSSQTTAIREACLTLTSNRLRSALMGTSGAIGVALLTAVMFIGQGTREHILGLVASHGLDMIMVRPGGTAQVFATETDRTIVALTPVLRVPWSRKGPPEKNSGSSSLA